MSRILSFMVIDDDDDDLELFNMAVQRMSEHVNVIGLNNAKTALDQLAKGARPDVIFVDLNMPRIDGREVLKQIKADDAIADIPVVVISTSTSTFDIDETVKSGAAEFIIKPSSMELLTESINNFIKIKFKKHTNEK